MNNGATAAPVGLWPDLLCDSGKPQSQTPEESAEEGEDQTSKGMEPTASSGYDPLHQKAASKPASVHGACQHGLNRPRLCTPPAPRRPGAAVTQMTTAWGGARRTGVSDHTMEEGLPGTHPRSARNPGGRQGGLRRGSAVSLAQVGRGFF